MSFYLNPDEIVGLFPPGTFLRIEIQVTDSGQAALSFTRMVPDGESKTLVTLALEREQAQVLADMLNNYLQS